MTTTTPLVLTFVCPLPYRGLSPNHRRHWRERHAAAKRYREQVWACVLEALDGRRFPAQRVRVSLEFRLSGERKLRGTATAETLSAAYLRSYRPYDVDNAVAAFKPGQDGICDVLGVRDDAEHLSLGEATIVRRHPEGPGVRVTVEIATAS